jgi:hypothetical protein
MLTQDTTAFVEQITVPRPDKRADQLRLQAASAELEAAHVSLELRLAEETLKRLGERSDRDVGALASHRFGFRRHDPAAVREAHARMVTELRDRLRGQRARVKEIEHAAQEHEARRPHNTWYRLHSAQHHATYSEAQFERMAEAQQAQPVPVTRVGGRRWWWYLGRFWWDNVRLEASEVRARILEGDLASVRQGEDQRLARSIAVGERSPSPVRRAAGARSTTGRSAGSRTPPDRPIS